MVRLDGGFKQALCAEVQLVGFAPDGKAFLDIGNRFKTLKCGVVFEVFRIVAVGDQVALIAERTGLKVGCIEAQKLGFTDLLCVTK